jgi:hypothetical protein
MLLMNWKVVEKPLVRSCIVSYEECYEECVMYSRYDIVVFYSVSYEECGTL